MLLAGGGQAAIEPMLHDSAAGACYRDLSVEMHARLAGWLPIKASCWHDEMVYQCIGSWPTISTDSDACSLPLQLPLHCLLS